MTAPSMTIPRTRTTDNGDTLTHHVTGDGRWLRAYDRARASTHKAIPVSAGVFKRYSDTRRMWHFQYLTGLTVSGWECTCEAGRTGVPCDHLASVFIWHERRYRSPRLSDLPETDGDLFEGEDADVQEAPELRPCQRVRLEDIFGE